MSTVTLNPLSPVVVKPSLNAINADWQHDVGSLADSVQLWAEEEGWAVYRASTEINEEMVGAPYEAPVLTIEAPDGRLLLQPIARGVLGAEGRVDLTAWPSHYRVMLLRRTQPDAPSEWIIRTESGLDWPCPWGKKTFGEIATGLMKAE